MYINCCATPTEYPERHIQRVVRASSIVCSYLKVTNVNSKNLLMKSSKNDFIFLPAFYLVMCLMKAPKNF